MRFRNKSARAGTPGSLIQLRDVARIYDLGEVKVEALKATTFDIERGEYIALVGQSGSGKSTLMNTLGCLDRPTSGSYLLDGVEIVTMSRDERARIRNRQIGFVFQNFNLVMSIINCNTDVVQGFPGVFDSRVVCGDVR